MIPRAIENKIISKLFQGKVHIVVGARQSGKTTLAQRILEKCDVESVWLNGDETDVREKFLQPTSTKLKAIIGKARIAVIDEAQRIENIGICLKLLVDTFPDTQVIATGSSSFELANKINEPLTGRKWEHLLMPLSYEEMVAHTGQLEEHRLLEHRLVYGSYPEIVTSPGNEKPILKQLADSYLYKDILTWERINKPDRLERLAMALAMQIGNEVSYSELGQITGLDNETVEKYITLLEKVFVIFRLYAFSRNLRNELKKSRKIYFYDVGIRNALINNFNPPSMRPDIGALWENYLIAERLKYSHYNDLFANRYFWRTTQQQEIDFIEEHSGLLHAYEFKWNPRKKSRFSKTFLTAYPKSKTHVITPENFENFVMKNT